MFLKKVLAFVIFILISWGSFSQTIVHVENKRLGNNKQGFSGTINLNFSFLQNQNSVIVSNNNAQFQYVKKKSNFLFLNAFNITSINGEGFVNDGFHHLRYGYKLNKIITLEAFSQFQYNKILKIDSRFLNGIGPRFSLLKTDSTHLYIGTLYMYEYETETTPKLNTDNRLSIYISLGLPVTKIIAIDMIAYYQPNLEYFNDYRTSIENHLDFEINKNFSFRLSVGLNYDAKPPNGINNLIYSVQNGMTLGF